MKGRSWGGREELARIANACLFLKACLLVHRPTWGLVALERAYASAGQGSLLQKLSGFQGLCADCLTNLALQALVASGQQKAALRFIKQHLKEEDLVAFEEFLSRRIGLEAHTRAKELILLGQERQELRRI
jgi:hypothetical protein